MPPLLSRVKAAATAFFTPSRVGFGPGEPIPPMAPGEPVRREDYQSGRNYLYTPRAAESRPVTFAQLRALADVNSILRTCIEKRKDEMRALDWGITVRKNYIGKNGEGSLYEEDARKAQEWLEHPDGVHTFDVWLGPLLEDLFVLDAPTLYRNKDRLGRLISLDTVDGSTIDVLVDDQGRVPRPPSPAYEQIIKGAPRTWWTTDELLYRPYNLRSNGVYGYSYVDGIIFTVNLALRRDTSMLRYFTDGNIPAGFVFPPTEMGETWNPDMASAYEARFNNMLSGDLEARAKLKMMPPGASVQFSQALTFDAMFDEWLARIICARFGVSPAPFVRMMNRATAESIEEAATDESLVPLMAHIKQMFDDVLRFDMKKPHLEFTWTSGQLHYQQADAEIDKLLLSTGQITTNELRESRGKTPYPYPWAAKPIVFTASGAQLMEDALKPQADAPGDPGGDGETIPGTNLPRRPFGGPKPAEPAGGAGGSPQDQHSASTAAEGDDEGGDEDEGEELKAWERFALARVGKASRPFETKALQPAMAETIRAALAGAQDAAAVKAVFSDARTHYRRSRTPVVRGELDGLIGEYEGLLRGELRRIKAG